MSNIIKLSSPDTNEFWEIPILFEDNHLLALEKPASLLTSPDRYDPKRPNLMKLLHRDIERGSSWAKEHQISYLANAHRLDFETSGIILLAKDKASLVNLVNQFGSEKPHKTYVALVKGEPEEENFEVNAKLALHPVHIGLMRVDEKRGKKSLTRFETLERFAGFTLLKCMPLTGRTHQIRVHLKHRRLSLVGDSKYGGSPLLLSSLKRNYKVKQSEEEKPLIGRVALHASELAVSHPATNTQVTITSPWPKDITVAVKYLRRFASK